jgi:hypothetical protein
MGVIGRYIDRLPDGARDRVIRAQEWCVAAVLGSGRERCLVGHAEDWRAFDVAEEGWRGWLDSAAAGPDERGLVAIEPEFRPELFAFRRALPADPAAYRARVERWGLASESRIGARFDRLCARRGVAGAVRLVKRRAARDPRSLASPATRGRPGRSAGAARPARPRPAPV